MYTDKWVISIILQYAEIPEVSMSGQIHFKNLFSKQITKKLLWKIQKIRRK